MIDVAQNYRFGLPVAASTYAAHVDSMLNLVHMGMYVIFIVWGLFFTYCLIRFRQGKNPKASYEAAEEKVIHFVPDALILIFELWLIFIIGMPVYSEIKEKMPDEKSSNVVQLIAEQFAWGFEYPGPDGVFGRKDPKQISPSNTIGIDYSDPYAKDDYVSLNELHVPVNQPTLIYLTSKDVIHSFFVPEFRVKQDVIPGMKVPLWFEPNKIGTYEIGCAQLCGLGHYRMRGEVVVQSKEDFEAWKQAKLKELQESLGQPAGKPS